MPENIRPELRSFIAEHIQTVAQLELLVLLRGDAQKSWAASQVARELGLAPEVTADILADLCQRGLLAEERLPEPTYRYQPRTEELAQRMGELEAAYRERRVTVITAIYAQPVDKLRRFADAFKIRKKEES